MGDHNSVDVAQCCRESILERAGCLGPSRQLVFGRPLPDTDVNEGVYIDDRLLVARVKAHRLRDPEAAEDTRLLASSREAYVQARLPRATKKAFDMEARFTAWGMKVDGVQGTCAAPPEKRLELFVLTM